MQMKASNNNKKKCIAIQSDSLVYTIKQTLLFFYTVPQKILFPSHVGNHDTHWFCNINNFEQNFSSLAFIK